MRPSESIAHERLGGDGNDVINARGGDDSVDAGAGNDTVRGDDGYDVSGGTGRDTLSGDRGSDDIQGGDNDDRISGGDDDLGTSFSFVDGAATLTGTTQSRRDKIVYSFTAPSSGRVDVTINPVNGRWIDLEVEQANVEAEDLLELEPADDDNGLSSGFFKVVGSLTYVFQVHSPDFLPSDFDVRLTLS
jgi:Ca2+-binding RTX toxin-like protein